MSRSLIAVCLFLGLLAGVEAAQEDGSRTFALRAGTVHLVEDGRVLEDATIIVENGLISEVGVGLAIPAHAEVVDYGPDAVIVPGFVAAWSSYASGAPSDRAVSPGTRAVDSFDPYGDFVATLQGGVTASYVAPSDYRLVSGVGAVVKFAGPGREGRVLSESAAIQGAIDALARNTPSFWEPPLPATVDVGIEPSLRQLPRSTMGALMGLEEILAAARSDDPEAGTAEYGRDALRDLLPLVAAGTKWRISAARENEIRGLLELARDHDLPLVIDRALEADLVADELAEAGVAVVFRLPYGPNGPSRDYGKEEDDVWPRFDVPAKLVEAGVRVAIAGNSTVDLLFSAALATRGGLDAADALRAITLTPAEIAGVDDRIGSIRAGKEADFAVLSTDPFSGYASVLATWIDGRRSWSRGDARAKSEDGTRATVLEVDELHVGDGTVLRPGQVLISGGTIVDVGQRVSHPAGAEIVRGKACMPGMIDGFGHLGLEGSRKVPKTEFELGRIVGPGDDTDRRVAQHGITTVVLTPRGASKNGAPLMAYKPAASDLDLLVVGDPVGLRLAWTNQNRLLSGSDVRELLEKGAEYRQSWIDYERALAAWTPPPPEAGKKEEDKQDEKAAEEEDAEQEKESDDDKKSKKKKKNEKKELDPDPITGVWESEGDSSIRMRLSFAAREGSGEVEGNLRAADLSSDLIEVEGYWNRGENALTLEGLGSNGWVSVAVKIEEEKLVGKATSGDAELELSLKQTSKEYVVARRPKPVKEEAEDEKEPKGKPRAPRLDERLEPVRRALDGELALVVDVDRENEILDCVAAFEQHGIEPVLYGARDAYLVADELVGRVRGVLLQPTVRVYDERRGAGYRMPYTELQNAGVPVAFCSEAEEGAIDLPLRAAYAIANGMSPEGALRALTSDVARMMAIEDRVGRIERGLDGDVLLLDGPPLAPGTSVLRAWVAGEEVR